MPVMITRELWACKRFQERYIAYCDNLTPVTYSVLSILPFPSEFIPVSTFLPFKYMRMNDEWQLRQWNIPHESSWVLTIGTREMVVVDKTGGN